MVIADEAFGFERRCYWRSEFGGELENFFHVAFGAVANNDHRPLGASDGFGGFSYLIGGRRNLVWADAPVGAASFDIVAHWLILNFVRKDQVGNVAFNGCRLHGECGELCVVGTGVHRFAESSHVGERAFEVGVLKCSAAFH